MKRTISEIKQAVMFIGLDTIKGLVSAILLKQTFKGESSISLERFWDDSLDLAKAMNFVGNRIKNKISVDTLYTIGLFQDCGIPILALKYKNYKKILQYSNENELNSISLEEKYYKTNHAILGYFVASSWNLPKNICQIILRHHDTTFIENLKGCENQLAFATLKISENIINRIKRGKDTNDWYLFEEKVFDILGITYSDFEDLQEDLSEYI